MSLTYNGSTHYYIANLQGDVMSIVDGTGAVVVSYKYDPYGNILSTTGTLADTLGVINPLRYRGYVYDQECNLYYLQSRYYDPSIGRFLNPDSYPSTGQGILGNNMFAYCGNNPVKRVDTEGYLWDLVWDVVSLGFSVAEVIQNPDDPMAWVGLAGDVIDVAVPFVGGAGETVRAVNAGRKISDAADNLSDTSKAVSNVTQNARRSAVRKAWRNEVDLVQNTGKGTRAWTDAEIEELVTTGKVKGYVGHHMRSVKGYPELAGDPTNIQFLTRQEHLQAHNGNWRNITHGRYEP